MPGWLNESLVHTPGPGSPDLRIGAEAAVGTICARGSDATLVREFCISNFLPCLFGADLLRVHAQFSDDVGEALPYLNSLMTDASYNASWNSISFKWQNKTVTMYGRFCRMSEVESPEQAEMLLTQLVSLLNAVWANKDNIASSTRAQSQLDRAMKLLGFLPRSNCGRCGELGCLPFAQGLAAARYLPQQCVELSGAAPSERSKGLEEECREIQDKRRWLNKIEIEVCGSPD